MQNKEISIQGSSIAKAENSPSFLYAQAHAQVKDMFAKYKFGNANSRDEFLKMLQTA